MNAGGSGHDLRFSSALTVEKVRRRSIAGRRGNRIERAGTNPKTEGATDRRLRSVSHGLMAQRYA